MKMRDLIYLLILCLCLLSCGETIILEGDNPGVIRTVAGGGAGIAQSGSDAVAVNIVQPWQVIALDMGDFYILETGFNRLLYVDSRGKIERIGGDGQAGFRGDGGNARDALFNSPRGIDIDDDGNVYIADTYNNRVRMIDPSGTITTIAGSDLVGFSGDGLPATEAALFKPYDIAVDPFGKIYITDLGNRRIRMVDENGIIWTIGGTGNYSFNGDGFSAEFANILDPMGIDLDRLGNVYFAVSAHHRVRMINTAGTITTVAGNGIAGFNEDGQSALGASLNYPTDVFIRGDGRGFYIADSHNHRIRYVDSEGNISSVAGNGEDGYNGDGLFATEANLDGPSGIWLDIFSNLFIADTDNFRIRKIPFP
jgi:DNA-binding beta-propeller fold protein YncE